MWDRCKGPQQILLIDLRRRARLQCGSYTLASIASIAASAALVAFVIVTGFL